MPLMRDGPLLRNCMQILTRLSVKTASAMSRTVRI